MDLAAKSAGKEDHPAFTIKFLWQRDIITLKVIEEIARMTVETEKNSLDEVVHEINQR